MSKDLFKHYTDKLDIKEEFIPLLKKFIHKSVEDQYSEETNTDNNEITYGKFYERFVNEVFLNNVENVFKYCESQIEKKFLNSFMLLFLRNRMPCLFVTSPFKNTEVQISNYRNYYKSIDALIESYKQATQDHDLIHLEERLEQKQKKGEYTEEEVQSISMYCRFQKVFEFDAYHITPQAFFPNLKVDNKAIRADFFIWVPNDPSVKIIVECDGFQFHNSKSSFINDKKRDRLFQLNGYRVIRYSGSEIYQDPVKISSDLFDLLGILDKDENEKRLI
jgi:hypothetical protein